MAALMLNPASKTPGFSAIAADLSGSLADPRKLDLIRATFPDDERVTTAAIRAAAKTGLNDAKAWRPVIAAKPAP